MCLNDIWCNETFPLIPSLARIVQYVINLKQTVLDPQRYQPFPLIEKQQITHNTKLFRFGLPKEDDALGLPIGQHMSFRATVEGKEVYRPYTPTSTEETLGHFDLVVKVYEKGNMSQYLDHLKIGDTIDVKGPKGKFNYTPNMKRSLGMLAGGTGITPMFQIIQAVLNNPLDKTRIRLVFGNLTEEDILLREKLEDFVSKHPDQFEVYHVLNNPGEGWKQGKGFITPDIIQEHIPAPSEDSLVLMCGPTPMNNAMVGHLTKLGYSEQQYFIF